MTRLTLVPLSVSVLFGLFQSLDFFSIADKYGIPLAFCVAMFYVIRYQDKKVNDYREQTLKESQSQTMYLKSLLAEQRLQTVCQYNSAQIRNKETTIK